MLALACAGFALTASASKASLVVIDGGRPVETTAAEMIDESESAPFPEEAITTAPLSVEASKVFAPESKNAPARAIDPRWPKDTTKTFLPSCTGLRPQFVTPCTCIITQLMEAMAHDEFIRKSEAGTLEDDPRLQQIRLDCVVKPGRKE